MTPSGRDDQPRNPPANFRNLDRVNFDQAPAHLDGDSPDDDDRAGTVFINYGQANFTNNGYSRVVNYGQANVAVGGEAEFTNHREATFTQGREGRVVQRERDGSQRQGDEAAERQNQEASRFQNDTACLRPEAAATLGSDFGSLLTIIDRQADHQRELRGRIFALERGVDRLTSQSRSGAYPMAYPNLDLRKAEMARRAARGMNLDAGANLGRGTAQTLGFAEDTPPPYSWLQPRPQPRPPTATFQRQDPRRGSSVLVGFNNLTRNTPKRKSPEAPSFAKRSKPNGKPSEDGDQDDKPEDPSNAQDGGDTF